MLLISSKQFPKQLGELMQTYTELVAKLVVPAGAELINQLNANLCPIGCQTYVAYNDFHWLARSITISNRANQCEINVDTLVKTTQLVETLQRNAQHDKQSIGWAQSTMVFEVYGAYF